MRAAPLRRFAAAFAAAGSASAALSLSPAPHTAPPARAFNTRTASGYAPAKRFRVGVLGATGAVGQRFVEHLEGHPWFEVTRLGASERSVGKAYAEAANWMVTPNVPSYVRDMKVVACEPGAFGADVDLVFSALVRVLPLTLPPLLFFQVSPRPPPRRTHPLRPL